MPPPFALPYALLFWPVYLWAWWPEFRLIAQAPLAQPASTQDRGSVRVVFFTVGVAITGAFLVAFLVPQAAIKTQRPFWFLFGTLLLASGSLLRRHCFRVLGQSFTPAVTVHPGQELVQRGAYRWVRHPSYTGALLLLGGIGLALGSWFSFGLLVLTALVVYTYRARIEERALLATLGEPYRLFMSTRKRFVPFIY